MRSDSGMRLYKLAASVKKLAPQTFQNDFLGTTTKLSTQITIMVGVVIVPVILLEIF